MRRLPHYIRIIFGLILLGVLIWYFDISRIIKPLGTIDPTWVSISALLIIASTLISAVNLHLFINQEGQLPLRTFLPLYWLSWAVGIVTPGQVGDIASITALLKRKNMAWHTSLGRSILDKLISFITMLAFALYGMSTLIGTETNSTKLELEIIAAAMLMTGCYIGRNRIAHYFAPSNAGWRGLVGQAAAELATTAARSPGKVLLNVSFTIARIILIGLCYWSMFTAMGHVDIDALKVIPLVAATSIVAYLPISFNGVGTVELAGVMLFATLGIAPAEVLSAYMALRLLVIGLAWAPAGLWLLFSSERAV